jgi:hypothetical protein
MFIDGDDIKINGNCGCGEAPNKKTSLEQEVKMQRYALIVLALLVIFKK